MENGLYATEIIILQKLSLAKESRIRGEIYNIDSTMFDLKGEVEPDIEIGYHINFLHNQKYIVASDEDAVIRDDSINYKGSNITQIRWGNINLKNKGESILRDIEIKRIKKAEFNNFLIAHIKLKYAEEIKILSDYESYMEISINADGNTINGVFIDKHLLPLIQEYTWSINKDNMIITKGHYCKANKRNISINQLLFEDELKELKILTGKKHVAYYINGNNLDKRRGNLIFMTRSKQYAARNLNRITGIYTLERKKSGTRYEVRIKKGKDGIYLINTPDYPVALSGAFLLRFLFWGKEYTRAFTIELDIDDMVLDNLETAVQHYKDNGSCLLFEQELVNLHFDGDLVINILKVIDKWKQHLV